VAFGHDSRTVVAADHLEATVRVYDVGTGKERAAYRFQEGQAGEPMTLAVSPDGRLLAVAMDHRVTLLRMDRLPSPKAGRGMKGLPAEGQRNGGVRR
jgi:hypothetical protein